MVDPLTRDFFVLLAGARCTPEAAAFAQLIEDDPAPLISAASVLEAGIVLISHYGLDARGNLRDFLAQGGRQVEPVTSEQVDLALETYQWYGKGRHRAGPNFTIAEGIHRFACSAVAVQAIIVNADAKTRVSSKLSRVHGPHL